MRASPVTGSSSNHDSIKGKTAVRLNSRLMDKTLLLFSLIPASLGIIMGGMSLSLNSLEAYPVKILGLLSLDLFILFFYIKQTRGTGEKRFIIIFILAFLSALLLSFLPEYLHGAHINGIIHRSFFSALLLLSISVPSLCLVLYYFMGATPKSHELSKYPLIILPIILVLIAYGLIIFQVFKSGLPEISWQMLITPYDWRDWQVLVWQNDWPAWENQFIHQTGILNYILGTLLLMGLTSAISLPIGMAVGTYITEYSNGLLANILRFSCTALKSISIFILGLTAFALVAYTHGTFLSDFIAGYAYDVNGNKVVANGSFFLASMVISLLVIPIIARATEEGIKSAPADIKEGSLALGASREHTLLHILIPWSLPNIITGLLLGCAEAAGSLATIWFIAGTGESGVNPFNQVTSLSYFIYKCSNSMGQFTTNEGIYKYSAAIVLLIITIGFSVAALYLKKRFKKRYQGI